MYSYVNCVNNVFCEHAQSHSLYGQRKALSIHRVSKSDLNIHTQSPITTIDFQNDSSTMFKYIEVNKS